MATKPPSVVALLPIQPRYADAIIRGEKRVEFRRRGFARDVEYVVIYASSPVKRVLGFFRVSGTTEACPSELWDMYHLVGAIEEEAYQRYYQGTERGYAIQIDRVCVLNTPVPLSAIEDELRAPQSYRYFDHSVLDRIAEASIHSTR